MDRELIERLAKEAGCWAETGTLIPSSWDHNEALTRLAALIAEECAKVCDDQRDGAFRTAWDQGRKYGAFFCAQEIRRKFSV